MVFSGIRNRARDVVSNVKQKATNLATTVKSVVTRTPTPAPTPPRTTTPAPSRTTTTTPAPSRTTTTTPAPSRTTTTTFSSVPSSTFQSTVTRTSPATSTTSTRSTSSNKSSSSSSSGRGIQQPQNTPIYTAPDGTTYIRDEKTQQSIPISSPDTGYVSKIERQPNIDLRRRLQQRFPTSPIFDRITQQPQQSTPTYTAPDGTTYIRDERTQQSIPISSPDTGYVPKIQPKIEPWTPPIIYDGIERKKEPIYREDKIIEQITQPTIDERKQRETTLSQLGYAPTTTGRVTMGFGFGPMPGYQAIRTGQRDNVIKDYAADFFNRKQALPTLDPGYQKAQKSVDRMFGESIASGRNFRAEFGDPIKRTKKKMRKFL